MMKIRKILYTVVKRKGKAAYPSKRRNKGIQQPMHRRTEIKIGINLKKMTEWPVEPVSTEPIWVNSMETNDNIPTGIGLVYTAAEVKFYPYNNTAFFRLLLFHCVILLFNWLAENQLDHFSTKKSWFNILCNVPTQVEPWDWSQKALVKARANKRNGFSLPRTAQWWL